MSEFQEKPDSRLQVSSTRRVTQRCVIIQTMMCKDTRDVLSPREAHLSLVSRAFIGGQSSRQAGFSLLSFQPLSKTGSACTALVSTNHLVTLALCGPRRSFRRSRAQLPAVVLGPGQKTGLHWTCRGVSSSPLRH